MRIATYNIQDGGSSHWDKEDDQRLPVIIEVLKTVNPDIVALQEAKYFDRDGNARLKQVASALAFDHYALGPGTFRSPNAGGYHVAILSRYPFEVIDKFEDQFHHAGLQVVVTDPQLGEVAICTTHVIPREEKKKIPQIEAIIEAQEKYGKAVILGDFNSISRDENLDVTNVFGTENDYAIRMFTKGGQLCFDVTDRMLEAGYTEALHHLSNATPTTPTPKSIHYDNGLEIRCDRIYVSSDLIANLKGGHTVHTDLSDQASDHYPVVIDLGVS